MDKSKAETFMREALKVARLGSETRLGSEKGELPIGAVVVLNDDIIASAHTQEASAGRLLIHAELLALETADKLKPFPGKRRDVALFTICEPCLMCMGAAMSFFLGKIYYAHEAPGDGAVTLVENWQRNQADFPNHRIPKITGGILRDEALSLFADYVTRHSSGQVWEWAKTIAALR